MPQLFSDSQSYTYSPFLVVKELAELFEYLWWTRLETTFTC